MNAAAASRRHLFHKKLNRSFAGNVAVFLLLFMLGCFIALPFVYAVAIAFMPGDELFLFPPRFLPMKPTLQNFVELLIITNTTWVPLSRYILNTLLITAAGTAGHVFLASMAAYVLAKHRFFGSNAIFQIIVLSLMFSPSVVTVPNYILIANLHWIDNWLSIIVPAFAASLGLYLLKQFIEQVPDSLLESARIDGAGEFIIYSKIIMPIVKPAWLTLIILSVQNLWNGSSGYIQSEQLKQLSQVLQQLAQGGLSTAGATATVSLVMMLVPITTFILTQSQIIETMSTSGLKE